MEENKNSQEIQNKSAEQRQNIINNATLNLMEKKNNSNNSSKKEKIDYKSF